MAEEKKTTGTKKTTSTGAKKTTTKKVEAVAETPVVEAAPKATKAKKALPQGAPNRLKDKYNNVVRPALLEKYHYSSVMQIPQVAKVVINIGVGDATQDSKRLEQAVNELTLIAGQKPVITKAKKSIASFKLREGQEIGCKVTLRGVRMYEFLDKLMSISLPRVHDFRGVSRNAFDGRGNYTLGIKEQSIFPEIEYDKIQKIRGMDIVIVTTATTDEEAFTLLELLGMPFQR